MKLEDIPTITFKIEDFIAPTEYILIYPTLGDICHCNRARMHELLQVILKAGDVQDVRIIRIHKDMPYCSGLAIADYHDGVYEFITLCNEGLTPYQALEDLDLL